MDAAAECFTLAGCYRDAVEAYSKGDKFSNCLSVCKTGKLFDEGLHYIECWKADANVQSKEIEQIEQEFLESCALDYHEHKDPNSMMKFVRAFCSMKSKHLFLRTLGCLDELLWLEEESGHFFEVAELARSWGDVLKEADLLEKAGQNKEAAVLLLWYSFLASLWRNGNRGWPMRQFCQKICRNICKFPRKTYTYEGQKVAVKVQHTHMTDTAAADLATVELIVNTVHRFFPSFDYRLTRYRNFNEGHKRILVATDLVGRGIDIVLNQVQERFEVDIKELPEQIDASTYTCC